MKDILQSIWNLTVSLHKSLREKLHKDKIKSDDVSIDLHEIPNLGCWFYTYDKTGFIDKKVLISLLKKYYITLAKLLNENKIPIFPYDTNTHSNVFHSNLNLTINKPEINKLKEIVMAPLVKENMYFINGILVTKETLHTANITFEYHNLMAYISYRWNKYKNLAPIIDIIPIEDIPKYLQNRGLLLRDIIVEYYNFCNEISDYDITEPFRRKLITAMDKRCENLSDEDKLYIELNKRGY